MENVTPEQIKSIVSSLLGKKSNQKFDSTIDISVFLWKVVDKVISATKNTTMTIQEKEDYLVKISEDVISHLEEKGFITVELAQKSRAFLKTADVCLDILIGIYNAMGGNKNGCIHSLSSVLCCFSAKAVATQTNPVFPTSEKVEVLPEEEVKPTKAEGTGL